MLEILQLETEMMQKKERKERREGGRKESRMEERKGGRCYSSKFKSGTQESGNKV